MSKRAPGIRYSRYEDIPLFLDATDIVRVLGASPSTVYCLMHAYDFPVITIGNRRMIRKEKFFAWLDKHPFTDAHGNILNRHPQTNEIESI